MHTFRLKAGDNPAATQYEYGYQANDPDAGNPGKFVVQGISTTPLDAKNQVHLLNKKTPGEGHP
jgi:hypothetical protein